VRRSGRSLCLECSTRDPILVSPPLDIPCDGEWLLLLRMSCAARARRPLLAAIYYATSECDRFSEDQVVYFRMLADEEAHDYVVPIAAANHSHARFTRLRFDPLDGPGSCEVSAFSIRPASALSCGPASAGVSPALVDRARQLLRHGYERAAALALGAADGWNEPGPEALSPARQANSRQVRRQLALGSETCKGYPEANLFLTNRCIAACVHCTGNSQFDHLRRTDSLPTPILRGLADELFPRVRKVFVGGGGEPLSAPADLLSALVERLSAYGCRMELNTNGVLLRPALRERIFPVVHTLHVSLDAATPETYQRLRPSPAGFEEVLQNVVSFMELDRKSGRDVPPLLNLSFTLLCSNVDEAPAFVRLAADLGASSVIFRHLLVGRAKDAGHAAALRRLKEESLLYDRARSNRRLSEVMSLCEDLGLSYLGPCLFPTEEAPGRQPAADSRASRAVEDGQPPPNSSWCADPWSKPTILADGTVRPCCSHGDVPTMGSLRDSSFFEIWNGEPFRRLRRTIGTGDMPGVCKACFARDTNYQGIGASAFPEKSLIRVD